MTESLTRKAFFWRRLHSLLGLWLVLFLIQHLFTNSQAALFFGDDGNGFVRAVNSIQNLPYLPVIEASLIGLPLLIHGYWGIKYIFTGESNSKKGDGARPSLPEYPRNHAYTWQRITSWILLVAIVAHVIQMRFVEYPSSAKRGDQKHYVVRLQADLGLYTLAERLGVDLYDKDRIAIERNSLDNTGSKNSRKIRAFFNSMTSLFDKDDPSLTPKQLIKNQEITQHKQWVKTLEKYPLQEGEILAVSPNFGTAELLIVRDTFKLPSMIVLYTLFVLAACFHAFNGLWTCMITWGVCLSERSQNKMRTVATTLMVLIASLGLVSIWATYWINLRN